MSIHTYEICFALSVTDGKPIHLKTFIGFNGLPAGAQTVRTGVRAFDAKSYHWSRLLVRERTFGLINRACFFYLDLNSGVRYVFDSEQVAANLETKRDEKFFILRRVKATATTRSS